ncbi:MAG: winged helix-turn-helix domain-containing protein [Lysobacterales bacterium]
MSTPAASNSELNCQGVIQIAQCEVDLDALTVSSAQGQTSISYKSALVLRALYEQPGKPVTRRHLLQTVWADSMPTDEVLSHAITELRRAMGDSPRQAKVIQTIPRVGYRLRREALSCAEATATASALVSPETALTSMSTTSLSFGPMGAVLVLVGVITLAMLARTPAVSVQPDPRMADRNTARAITFDYGVERGPVLSPDGQTLAYVAQGADDWQTDLFVRPVDSGKTRQLTHSVQFEAVPDFSPDGQSLVFLRGGPRLGERRQIILLDLQSGSERELTTTNLSTTLDFSPDGKRVLFSRLVQPDGIRLHEHWLALGEDRLLAYPRTDSYHELDGRYAPDNSAIAFRRGINPSSEIVLLEPGQALRPMFVPGDNVYGMRWQADSQSLMLSVLRQGQAQLMKLTRSGELSILPYGKNGTEPAPGPLNNQLVYVRWNARTELRQTNLSTDAPSAAPFQSTGSDHAPALSLDGNLLAFVSDRSGSPQIWVGNPHSGELRQLSDQPTDQWTQLSWNNEFQNVTALQQYQGQLTLWRFPLDGRPSKLLHHDGSGNEPAVTAAIQVGRQQVVAIASEGGQVLQMGPDGGRKTLAHRQALHMQAGPNNDVYFFDPQRLNLARISLTTGAVTDLDLPVGWANQQGWQVGENDVAVLDYGRNNQPWLRRFRLPDLSLSDSRLLSGKVGDFQFHLSGDQIVYSTIVALDSDIMLAQR